MAFTNDAVADAVAPTAGQRVDVVVFRGWLGNGDTITDALGDPVATARLYLDTRFSTWLEIPDPANNIVAQFKTKDHEGASLVWVPRLTTIVKCQAGFAIDVATAMGDDGGAAHYPHH